VKLELRAMKKILVTGANSFTASHVIPFLASQGYEIQGLTRSLENRQFVPTLNIVSDFIRPHLIGDLSDPSFTENLTYKPDVILHLAANHGRTDAELSRIKRDNIGAVSNLISFSKRIECPKVIALSSISVHGTVSTSTVSAATGFKNPNIYGHSKREVEILLQQLGNEQNVFILRLPSILGQGAKNHWLSTVLESALSNSTIRFQNASSKFNNAVYIDDLSIFISHLISENYSGVHAFPLASTEPITIDEIVRLLVEMSGSFSKLESEVVERSTFTIDDLFARKQFGYTSRTTRSAVESFALDALRNI
jgi:dihydroflavonol-4-reductase